MGQHGQKKHGGSTPPPSAIECTEGVGGGGGFGPRCCELRPPQLLPRNAAARRAPGGPQPHCCAWGQRRQWGGEKRGGTNVQSQSPLRDPPTLLQARSPPRLRVWGGEAGFGGSALTYRAGGDIPNAHGSRERPQMTPRAAWGAQRLPHGRRQRPAAEPPRAHLGGTPGAELRGGGAPNRPRIPERGAPVGDAAQPQRRAAVGHRGPPGV